MKWALRSLKYRSMAALPLSQLIVSYSRKLGMQTGVGIETDEDCRMALLQTPRDIMDWIAVPNFSKCDFRAWIAFPTDPKKLAGDQSQDGRSAGCLGPPLLLGSADLVID